ncbi:MAG: Gfo/Idh/MocA family oxidoreductase [Sedimentisphaerales bacterium]|nr:Gfo/Idh/MocA family oxidoreductase [Sedimentisphaerales bacterium]
MAGYRNVTRRSFLQKSAGLTLSAMGLPYVVRPSALGRAGAVAPSERITVGTIGVGPQGIYVMRNFLAQDDCRVVAVCDVKKPALEAAQAVVNERYRNADCVTYADFRELIARPDIDVVHIATCDHWHVPVALEAARAGKAIYLEKPMGLSLAEDQALRDACRRYGTIFQFGTQQRSERNFRFACELVRNGRIGKLHTINVWCSGSSSGGPAQPVAPPDWIDYDMWLGPAPYHPCTPDRYTNQWWWFISDYALGFIAGWGVHPLDIALWGGAEKLSGPVEIEGKGVWPDPAGVCDTATNWNVVARYASGVTLNFTGNPVPEAWRSRYGRISDHGTAFEGDAGWVHIDRAGLNAYPRELLTTELGPNELHLYASNNHARDLLDAVRSRRKAICPIDAAVQADILCHISDIAIRLERRLRWDPDTERFTDDAANRRLVRALRSPWRL